MTSVPLLFFLEGPVFLDDCGGGGGVVESFMCVVLGLSVGKEIETFRKCEN